MSILAQIELEFGDGLYRFRLPPVHVDKIQKSRGYRVTWPDGSEGMRPKPVGMIMREIMGGEFDILDCIAIIQEGLIAGGGGVVDGEDVTMTATKARMMVEDVVNTWPIQEVHDNAAAIIRGCWFGVEDKEDKQPGNDPATAGSST